MPVFDFSNDTSEIKEEVVCTYTTFSSNADHATIECPILILSQNQRIGGSGLCPEGNRAHGRPDQPCGQGHVPCEARQ